LHFQKDRRRRILYATAAVLVTGSLICAAKDIPAKKGNPQESAAAASALQSELIQEKLDAHEAAAPASAAGGEGSPQQQQSRRDKPVTYKVVEGDTVSSIAERYGLKTETILWANDLTEDSILSIGQELVIPPADGVLYTIQNGDTLWDLATDYGIDEEAIVKANPDLDPNALQPGQKVILPGAQPRANRQVASRGDSGGSRNVRASGKLSVWPTTGPITDRFGWRVHPVYGSKSFHDGMDISVPAGTPLRAAAAGTVTMASRYGGYGLVVRIDHGNGVTTMYAHMSQIDVEVGQHVEAGQHIGYSGNTGVSTGPHLHFTVLVGGSPTDPLSWLP
jgi:murein DD-endopeptidase MepM/ murein hydrolase activator NlpD